jgi:hypothetical protein
MLFLVLSSSQSASADDTGWLNPSQNKPQLDYGDGFEVTPQNAYADGGGVAVSVTNPPPAAEGHSFYGFSFSIPAGKVITGIEVRLDWYMNEVPTGYAYVMACMSWNGGVNQWSWTYVDETVSSVEKTTIFGSPSDDWGHEWDTSELNGNDFILSVGYAESEGKTFYLDWAAVKIYYGDPRSTPVGGELLVSNEPQNLVSMYGLVFSTFLVVPAAAIFYLEKKKRRK